MAPLFSFITNFIEIRVKLQSMTKYSQRTYAEGASGIGAWLPVMELISLVCIPINVGMIMWTGNYDIENREPLDSTLVQELRAINSDPDRWTNYHILFLLIILEHIVICAKVIIAVIIPDVPQTVLYEEYKLEQVKT